MPRFSIDMAGRSSDDILRRIPRALPGHDAAAACEQSFRLNTHGRSLPACKEEAAACEQSFRLNTHGRSLHVFKMQAAIGPIRSSKGAMDSRDGGEEMLFESNTYPSPRTLLTLAAGKTAGAAEVLLSDVKFPIADVMGLANCELTAVKKVAAVHVDADQVTR